ncbi:MAG: hypothetical protein ACRDSP_18870 [Pseudonocardiaceae bacterium]
MVCTGRAQTALLDTYQAERRPIATEVLAATSGLTRLVLGDTALARLVRDYVGVPLLNRPCVQRLIWENASQLKIGYRRGPLAERLRNPLRTGPRPGDRIADLTCRRADGRRTRLHAELGSRWVLLQPVASGPADDYAAVARGHLGDAAVTVLSTSAAKDIMVVRPDAHLGWRGPAAPDVLDQWLTGILGS